MENNIRPKKNLGQNFLREISTLQKITDAAELKNSDRVLEIGTGTGTLTKLLADNCGTVITVEKDTEILRLAQQALKDKSNITFLNQDVLKLNVNRLQLNSYKVVGNIPYYLTGKLLQLILEEWPKPELAVLLVQAEVATKLLEQRKRSILSVITQLLANIEKIGLVSRKLFWPMPRVNSAIIKITPWKTNVFQANPNLKQLIKTGFSSPRKLLISNLKNSLPAQAQFQFDPAKLSKAFQKLNLAPSSRAENLSPETWVKLSQSLF